jgi:hypothetical protein
MTRQRPDSFDIATLTTPQRDGRMVRDRLAQTVPARLTDRRLFRELAFVGGKWRSANSGATLTVVDPATGEPIGSVPDMGID